MKTNKAVCFPWLLTLWLSFLLVLYVFLSLSSILTLMNIIRPVHTIYNITVTFRFSPSLLSYCKRLVCALQQDIAQSRRSYLRTANDHTVDNLIGYLTFNLLIPSFFSFTVFYHLELRLPTSIKSSLTGENPCCLKHLRYYALYLLLT